MKVICDRAALLNGINLVSGAVAARTPKPQLQCIKLSATAGKAGHELVLAATDAEIAIRLRLATVDVKAAGEALIMGDKLRGIVSAEDHEPTLTIEVSADACNIRGGDAKFRLLTYPPADFPPIPDFSEVTAATARPRAVFATPADQLRSVVERTIFATARETSRYAINGVLLKRDGKRLELVATDGRRLALSRAVVTSADKDAKPVTCIVPTKALQMLVRLMGDPEDTVQVAITDNQIYFALTSGKDSTPRAVLSSTLVEGTFPPYEDVIPKDQDKKVTFDRDVLSSAVRRAALLTNEESRGVRLKFTGADKRLELTSRAPEMGDAEVRVDLANYEGEDIEIGFNPSFITDALKVIPDNEVILELKAHNKPGLIKCSPKSTSEFLYVVMPVNLT
ncbi:MAG: DNA polymerase III subunit beta [Planctomycetota bacterium]|nr:DNA polymerase III subunit beta [Planctomycetota bacterium]